MVEFKTATYNIHRGIGVDGRYDLDRIVHVINELDCDVVGIQEIDSHALTEEGHHLNYIAKKTSYHVVAGPTLVKDDTEYGNALLTRFPVKVLRRIDLSYGRGEPRGAIDVDVDVHGLHCRIITTHLGLRFWERKNQLATIFKGVSADKEHPLVIMGDMNEWIPFLGATRIFRRHFGYRTRLLSYPSRFPVFGLDQVYVYPKKYLTHCQVHDTEIARIASDHLPVKAILKIQ